MTNDVKISQAPAVGAPSSAKRKKIASLDRRKARSGWLFVLPFLIGFVLIYLPLLIQSIQISVSQLDYDEQKNIVMNFVGFENYKGVLVNYMDPLTNQTFAQVLVEGLGALAFELPAILLFSLFMAVMLNQKMAGRALFRSIFFIPVIISTGIMQGVLASYNASGEGLDGDAIDTGEAGAEESTSNQLVSVTDLQWLFANMSVGQELIVYVTGLVNDIFNIVNRSGVQMLIFLAALQSISPAIYESCKIDGATGWETFWKITFPMISPMILVNAIYTIVDSFTVSTNPVMVFISETAGVTGQVPGREYSTAMAWIYFLIVILIVALIAGVMSAFVFYQRKND
ncbi:MAG: sugar ABC transporter permease [Clostridia bacterium]|nr:sugar ABC transporter permease [Clostridia bacterium]